MQIVGQPAVTPVHDTERGFNGSRASILICSAGKRCQESRQRQCRRWSPHLAHIKPFVFCSPAEQEHTGLLRPPNLGRKAAEAGRVRGDRAELHQSTGFPWAASLSGRILPAWRGLCFAGLSKALSWHLCLAVCDTCRACPRGGCTQVGAAPSPRAPAGAQEGRASGEV